MLYNIKFFFSKNLHNSKISINFAVLKVQQTNHIINLNFFLAFFNVNKVCQLWQICLTSFSLRVQM